MSLNAAHTRVELERGYLTVYYLVNILGSSLCPDWARLLSRANRRFLRR